MHIPNLERTHGQMVQEYFVERMHQVAKRRREALAAVRTRGDALKYVAAARRKIRSCFGAFPQRTPLNVKITGTVQREGYRIDKLTYESRPGYVVTANLYVPAAAEGTGMLPAVLGVCGHSGNGKAAGVYQAFMRSLAAMGYIALILDPMSQGERYQYKHLGIAGLPCDPCNEHNLAGNQQAILGEFFGTWRAWDAIRGLDYLLSRPEVDRTRVGCTGNSGGGTMTTWMAALDDRITMLAPGCFVTTFQKNLENELPADSEQYPPYILKHGYEMADCLIAAAPRPVILLGQQYDYFDIRGTEEAYADVRRIYKLLGREKDVELFVGPDVHGYHLNNREAMYRFFNKHAGVKAEPKDLGTPAAPDAELFATPTGKVDELKDNTLIYEFTAASARKIAKARRPVAAAKLAGVIAKTLVLPKRSGICNHRILRHKWEPFTDPFQNVHIYGVETEPELPFVQAFLQRWDRKYPLKGKGGSMQIEPEDEVLVYVPHISSRDDLTGGQAPVEADTVWSVDVRGMGMSRPLTCGEECDYKVGEGADVMYAGYAQMLGETYIGHRVHDLLCCLDLLVASGARRIHLAGRGFGAITAAYAAVLHKSVTQVTLKNAPRSLLELATAKVNLWPLSVLPWGVLRAFDLSECYKALRPKRLKLIDPWDAMMKPVQAAKRTAEAALAAE